MERERLQKLAEEEEVRRLRKELVPKAQLMPYFDRPFIPRRSNLFSCLLFNEMEAFNPRDQLAFAYVRDLMEDPKPKRPKGPAMICCMSMAAVAVSVRSIFWRCGGNLPVDVVCTRNKMKARTCTMAG